MTMRGRKDTVKAAEVLKAQESAKIPEVLTEQEGAAALEALKPQKKVKTPKVWNRRQKRLDHIAAVVRLAIRYLNARDRTTIYRNK